MPEREESLQLGPDSEDLPPVLSSGTELLPDVLPRYAELHCITNFSFQRGASHPHELVERAYHLGYEALAITDECSVAGVVQALIGLRNLRRQIAELEAAEPDKPRSRPFRLLFGAEFQFEEGCLVALARDLGGWGDLCEFITEARRRAVKGQYEVDWETSDLGLLRGCETLWLPRRDAPDALDSGALDAPLARARALFGSNLWLGVQLSSEAGDDLWLARLREAGERCGVPLVASGDVCMHKRSRKLLQDVITAVREGKPVSECGFALQSNGQRHLRYRTHLAQVFSQELLANTLEVARRCQFTLESIQYNYPMEPVPPGQSPLSALVRLTMKGARKRYGKALNEKHKATIRHELELIRYKKYEMYFLTVEDIVREARRLGILCQGRGSAANSFVCYCLGITEIKPELTSMLFERFISKERNEEPDIDVDFEHQRREEVIQYIYKKYGRDRAAIAAVVVRYRSRMAIRDVGKAMGVDERLVDAFAKDHFWFDKDILVDRLLAIAHDIGVQEEPLKLGLWMDLAFKLRGFPRHLSQHVGGFVLTQDKLTRLVPVENASMPDRSIIQWEKDDLEAMKLLKVDVLALGMLSALRRCMDMVNGWRGKTGILQHIPVDDPRVYDMICRADTVGVFQIESRAQMSMLPRLRPREYYDLVVEVAIVRPGPIQGGMVHPYLKARQRRREGKEIVFAK
ncbi:MAG: PHP domain-containing protein, partial [Haliea sp.]